MSGIEWFLSLTERLFSTNNTSSLHCFTYNRHSTFTMQVSNLITASSNCSASYNKKTLKMPSNKWTHAMTSLIMDCPLYKVPRRLRMVWQAWKYLGEVSISNWSWIHYVYRVSLLIKIQSMEVNTRVSGHIDMKYFFKHMVSRTRSWSLRKHFRYTVWTAYRIQLGRPCETHGLRTGRIWQGNCNRLRLNQTS